MRSRTFPPSWPLALLRPSLVFSLWVPELGRTPAAQGLSPAWPQLQAPTLPPHLPGPRAICSPFSHTRAVGWEGPGWARGGAACSDLGCPPPESSCQGARSLCLLLGTGARHVPHLWDERPTGTRRKPGRSGEKHWGAAGFCGSNWAASPLRLQLHLLTLHPSSHPLVYPPIHSLIHPSHTPTFQALWVQKF